MSMSCPSCGRIITKREIDQGRAVTVAEGLLCPECGEKHSQRVKAQPAATARSAVTASKSTTTASRAAPRSAPTASTSRSAPPAAARSRPAARVEVDDEDDDDDRSSARGRHGHVVHRERQDKVLQYVTIGGVILLVVAAVGGFWAWKKTSDRKAREDLETATNARLRDDLKRYKEEKPDDPDGLLAMIQKYETEVEDFHDGSGRRALALAKNDAIETQGRLKAQADSKNALDAAEKSLDSGGDPRDVLTKIENEVQPMANAIGPEFKTRMEATVKKATDMAAVRVKDDALKFAEDNKANPDVVFAKLNAAEDELRRLSMRNADPKTIAESVKALVERGDALAEAAFTPEKIAALPMRDLLAAADVGKWGKGGTVDFKIDNHVLTITGPPADTKDQGIVGIAEDEGIRDFVLECKFTVTKGSGFILMFRKEPTGLRTAQWQFKTEGLDHIPEGEPITVKVEARGVKGRLEIQPGDVVKEFKLGIDKARKGGFGFSCDAETVVTVSDIKVKIIR
ncbi:MAG: hypothetical protein U1E76_26285 [Planctomycetota bacterium]